MMFFRIFLIGITGIGMAVEQMELEEVEPWLEWVILGIMWKINNSMDFLVHQKLK